MNVITLTVIISDQNLSKDVSGFEKFCLDNNFMYNRRVTQLKTAPGWKPDGNTAFKNPPIVMPKLKKT